MLKLHRAERTDDDGTAPPRADRNPLKIIYTATHSNQKTTIDFPVEVNVDTRFSGVGPVVAAVQISTDHLSNIPEALDKLAEYLERTALAIRERGTDRAVNMVLYDELPR